MYKNVSAIFSSFLLMAKMSTSLLLSQNNGPIFLCPTQGGSLVSAANVKLLLNLASAVSLVFVVSILPVALVDLTSALVLPSVVPDSPAEAVIQRPVVAVVVVSSWWWWWWVVSLWLSVPSWFVVSNIGNIDVGCNISDVSIGCWHGSGEATKECKYLFNV